MREIKFRAWDKDEEWMVCNVQDAYDGLPYSKENAEHIVDSYDWVSGFSSFLDSDDFIPMQYTGLKDRNGVEIYEGDIALHMDYECFGYVVFSSDESAFAFLVITGSNNKGLTTEFEWLYDYADGLEVIGNIYENPELIEEEE